MGTTIPLTKPEEIALRVLRVALVLNEARKSLQKPDQCDFAVSCEKHEGSSDESASQS